MPSRQDERQITFADLDRKIMELGHAIALNPKHANAYRERGLLYGQKRDYDHAIEDLDRALSLTPNDARAHYLRGLAWHRKNEPKRAIADYDKAIELNPAKKLYRDNREKAERDAYAVLLPLSPAGFRISQDDHLRDPPSVSSHDRLGNTGRKTGFWLEESGR